MTGILNFFIGFLTTALVVLAIVYVFNRFTSGGVAGLGKEPLSATIKK